MVIFKLRGCVTQMRTKEDKGFAFKGSICLKNIQKQSRIKQNTVIFKGRGCVTLMRTRGRRALPLGVELTQKVSKTVKK